MIHELILCCIQSVLKISRSYAHFVFITLQTSQKSNTFSPNTFKFRDFSGFSRTLTTLHNPSISLRFGNDFRNGRRRHKTQTDICEIIRAAIVTSSARVTIHKWKSKFFAERQRHSRDTMTAITSTATLLSQIRTVVIQVLQPHSYETMMTNNRHNVTIINTMHKMHSCTSCGFSYWWHSCRISQQAKIWLVYRKCCSPRVQTTINKLQLALTERKRAPSEGAISETEMLTLLSLLVLTISDHKVMFCHRKL